MLNNPISWFMFFALGVRERGGSDILRIASLAALVGIVVGLAWYLLLRITAT